MLRGGWSVAAAITGCRTSHGGCGVRQTLYSLKVYNHTEKPLALGQKVHIGFWPKKQVGKFYSQQQKQKADFLPDHSYRNFKHKMINSLRLNLSQLMSQPALEI